MATPLTFFYIFIFDGKRIKLLVDFVYFENLDDQKNFPIYFLFFLRHYLIFYDASFIFKKNIEENKNKIMLNLKKVIELDLSPRLDPNETNSVCLYKVKAQTRSKFKFSDLKTLF